MRVAVIRGDLPGPVFLSDMEAVSQFNPPTEPVGQQKYVSRPTSASFGAVMAANAPASVGSTANIVFPLLINAGNQTLKIKGAAADPFTSVLIPAATYANMTGLLAAINSVLPSAFTAVPLASSPALRLALQTTGKGAGLRIQYDSTGGGSTANTPLALAAGGALFLVPAASAVITATVPVGGPVDVSPATIATQLGSGLTAAQSLALTNALAPLFVETDVAIKCFQVGELQDLRNAAFNPDPNRIPAIVSGAAVSVVQDDGTTPFTAPLPLITAAVWNTPVGGLTITGVGLAGPGALNSEVVETVVKILTAPDARSIPQAIITAAAGGKVSATSIVIPASKIPAGLGIGVGTKVQVRYTSLASNQFALT